MKNSAKRSDKRKRRKQANAERPATFAAAAPKAETTPTPPEPQSSACAEAQSPRTTPSPTNAQGPPTDAATNRVPPVGVAASPPVPSEPAPQTETNESTGSKPTEPARPTPFVPLLPYQIQDVNSNDRFLWNCWSRQTGKSFTKSLRRILRGLSRRRNQIFLSAGERQSRELMQKARQHCQLLRIATDYTDKSVFANSSFRQLELTLPGGVRIIGLPANPQTARGYTGDVFLDEFAMHANDKDIWASLFPTLLRGEGELDIASTPKGKSNLFYELASNPRFSKSTITLDDAIAQGMKVDKTALFEAMGDEELYRQEFNCEFLDESTAFLTYEQIAACEDPLLVTHDNASAIATDPRELFVGVDIGRKRDMTALWVFAKQDTSLKTVALIEMTGETFAHQFDALAELLSLRNVRQCCIDAGGIGMQLAEQAVQQFGNHRVQPIMFTAALKSQIAGALRVAVEARTITIPAERRIRNDWHSLRRDISEQGHFKLSAPRQEGSHADRFWAAALALHAAQTSSGPAESLATKPINFARKGTW